MMISAATLIWHKSWPILAKQSPVSLKADCTVWTTTARTLLLWLHTHPLPHILVDHRATTAQSVQALNFYLISLTFYLLSQVHILLFTVSIHKAGGHTKNRYVNICICIYVDSLRLLAATPLTGVVAQLVACWVALPCCGLGSNPGRWIFFLFFIVFFTYSKKHQGDIVP